MMKPYVNQRVWYYPAAVDQDFSVNRIGAPQPCAGVVCFVWPDGKVNLLVHDHQAHEHRRAAVRFIEDEQKCDRDYCTRVVTE